MRVIAAVMLLMKDEKTTRAKSSTPTENQHSLVLWGTTSIDAGVNWGDAHGRLPQSESSSRTQQPRAQPPLRRRAGPAASRR